ncbi:MAG: TonB-dependent receptor [Woeseiaceae bacterium]
MQKTNFHRTPLAVGVALAIGATASPTQVAAQTESDDETIEEVVVLGIRGSLKASADIKRASDGVVDAITAEDIGSFPDTNLAESLQRITGVSIDRERGEGSRVTVRGFGPAFNLVLLNGRQMPSSGVGNAFGNGTSRSFDFGNLASEAVTGVEVYKTGQADVPTGGIGATLNIKTTRPLDGPDVTATVAASAMYDDSRVGSSDYTPEISGLWSQKFADDKFGIAVSAVYQDRESGAAIAKVSGWRSFDANVDNDWSNPNTPTAWGGIPPAADPNQVNRPELPGIYSVPQTTSYELNSYDRSRTNGQLTLQFRPTDRIEATLDYAYAELEIERTYNSFGAWYNFGAQDTVWTDGPNATPLEYGETLLAQDFATNAGRDGFVNENNLLGLNLLWDVTDSLTLELDYHDSYAESGSNNPYGISSNLAVNAYTRDRTITYFGDELPVLELGLTSPLDPSQMVAAGSVFANEEQRMDIEQIKLAGQFRFDSGVFESIDFGVQMTEIDNRALSAVIQRDAWFANTNLGDLADLMIPANLGSAFDQFSGANDSRLQADFFRWDMVDVIERFEALMASGDANIFTIPDMGPCGTGLCASDNWQNDRRTEEDTLAVYAQAKMNFEAFNRPIAVRLGVRYEQTDINSPAETQTYTALNWNAPNEIALVPGAAADLTDFEGDYDEVLPNLDIAMDLTDEQVLRLSYSKTMARPDYISIQGGLTLNSPVRIDGGTGALGNPGLLPYISENIDVTWEWYYGEGSYVAVGYFMKEVENFIGQGSITTTPYNIPHPGLGPLADQARAATGASDSATIYAWILANLPNEEGVDAVAGTITGVEGRDPSAPFDLSVPVNQATNELDGWELNIQHYFGDSGFGTIANYTKVDSDDATYDNLNLGLQFPLVGLSDSANLVAFWENDRMGVRVAYNWREAFLAGTGQDNVGVGPPTYTDDYDQIDLNANFWITDNLQAWVDIINVTNETGYVYGRNELQPLFSTQQGARYNVGLRYKF